jgi:phosphoglycolate phosphatase-like HAD superfamily hydrolase
MQPVYVFDLDGTLADITHRLHYIQGDKKDWSAFFAACVDDQPIHHMLDLAWDLKKKAGRTVIYVSGRSDEVREQTEQWLFKHGAPAGKVYMRKAGDHKPDHELKIELLADLRADGYEPVLWFDDRSQVVKAVRAAGIPVCQVAEGEF